LKILVVEAFPGIMGIKGADHTWSRVSRTTGFVYDRDHGFWKDGLPFGFEEFVRRAPNSRLITDSTGFAELASVGWGGAATRPADSEWGLDHPDYLANMAAFETFAKRIADQRIHLVMVNFPTNPAYRGSDYYSPYGPRMEVGRKIVERFKAMAAASPFIHFHDAHNGGDHDYTDADAFDWGHLGSIGASKLTTRLDSLVNSLPLSR
jgi:hypothetical protein